MTKQRTTSKSKTILSARDYIRKQQEKEPGRSLSSILTEISQGSGIALATLRNHMHGSPVVKRTAEKLEIWSNGKISAAKSMGFES